MGRFVAFAVVSVHLVMPVSSWAGAAGHGDEQHLWNGQPPPREGGRGVLQAIHEDLAALDVFERPRTRYLTLTHLLYHPNETIESIDRYRRGAIKLLNSLSGQPEIVVPVRMGEGGSVLRFNLHDLGWTAKDWDLLVEIYPYGTVSTTPAGRRVQEWSETVQPSLRADWFAFAASQPPLYHHLLRLPGPDDALASLERALGVPRVARLRVGEALRAGTDRSAVSDHHRLVERHQSIHGAYWIAETVEPGERQSSLAEFPLGPIGVFDDVVAGLNGRYTPVHSFDSSGSAAWFTLPNGLHAYLLVDGGGRRVDVSSADILRDASMHRGGKVVAGISCLACHASGVQGVTDVVAERSMDVAHFSDAEREVIQRLHRSEFEDALQADRQAFERALQDMGVSATEPEPVRALFDRYIEVPVDVVSAASEVGLKASVFERRLVDAGENTLYARLQGDGMPRSQFGEQYGRILQALELGRRRRYTPIDFPWLEGHGVPPIQHGGPPFPARRPVDEAVAVPVASMVAPEHGQRLDGPVGLELLYLQSGRLLMGSPTRERGRDVDERQSDAEITGFFMATTETTQAQWVSLMGTTPWQGQRDVRAGLDYPACFLTVHEADQFCAELNARHPMPNGWVWALPREAEWEFACRAGSEGSFSVRRPGDLGDLGGVAWFEENAFDAVSHFAHPVATRQANDWGLYDLHGNVWEWCEDTYREAGPTDGARDPVVRGGSTRVLRGGSFRGSARDCRSANRNHSDPKRRLASHGFRVVLTRRHGEED